jgi:hypothetical protein
MKENDTLAITALPSRLASFDLGSVLVLSFLLLTANLFAQTAEKPRAFLFDEFERIGNQEIKLKTKKLRAKIAENAWSKGAFAGAYIIIWDDGNNRSAAKLQTLITNALFEDCRDCMGWDTRITLVRGGKAKRQRVQFWLIPSGAEPPTIETQTDLRGKPERP